MPDTAPEASALIRDLEGKVAIVTGGGSGIGLATARLLARNGARVVIADIDLAAAEREAEAIEADGLTATAIRTDVSAEADVIAMVDFARQRYGQLDILFNNAGISDESGSTVNADVARFLRVIEINLTGTFLGMKYGIAAMLESGGGSVINNASVAGLVGFANHAAYAASKGGVIQLTRTASIEFATKRVRVNCICPGFTETSMVGSAEQAAAATRNAFLKALHPMGRLAKPEEIAEMVLFLASERSSFTTGAVIPVDGGYVAR